MFGTKLKLYTWAIFLFKPRIRIKLHVPSPWHTLSLVDIIDTRPQVVPDLVEADLLEAVRVESIRRHLGGHGDGEARGQLGGGGHRQGVLASLSVPLFTCLPATFCCPSATLLTWSQRKTYGLIFVYVSCQV